ncbi:MAG: hypothetical protein FH761_17385 [Firmicutes bacterium]|nr:hypothetical protein [Bacillota bacterium]
MELLNRKLLETKSMIKDKERLKNILQKAKKQYYELESRKQELYEILKKEELDVEKLEGLSVKNIFHSIMGNKVEKLDKEKQEVLAAKFKYDTVCKELDQVTSDINEIKDRINDLGNLDKIYNELLEEKEKALINSSADVRNKLDNIIEQSANLKSRIKEIKEAITAGRNLMNSLEHVRQSLTSAGNWGVWDMMGGGLISTMAKHSKIDEAKSEINRVQSLLNRFHRELQDVGGSVDISNIEIGSFLTFADYFFDGLFADLAVQSKINDAKSRVENTIYKVNSIMSRLEQDLSTSESKLKSFESEKSNIIING